MCSVHTCGEHLTTPRQSTRRPVARPHPSPPAAPHHRPQVLSRHLFRTSTSHVVSNINYALFLCSALSYCLLPRSTSSRYAWRRHHFLAITSFTTAITPPPPAGVGELFLASSDLISLCYHNLPPSFYFLSPSFISRSFLEHKFAITLWVFNCDEGKYNIIRERHSFG